MSWQDQGRQEHGYFGSGTGPEKLADSDGLFDPRAETRRMTAAINASIAALPAKSRHSPFAKLGGDAVRGLAATMSEWVRARTLSDAEFAAAFFGREGGDPAVKWLRQAAKTAAVARSQEDLRSASTLLAKTGQQVGLDRWPSFINAATNRAAPISASAQNRNPSATDAADENRRVAPAETPANDRSDLVDRKAAQRSDTKNPGVEVRLPNGQAVPDEFSPTGKLMSPVGDLTAVATAGREAGATFLSLRNNPDTALGAIPYLLTVLAVNVGQGRKFDYQRQGNHLTGFTQLRQFRDVSNVNVGLFCQQAGLTLNETLSISGSFAKLFSGNAKPDQPNDLDAITAQFIVAGFELGRSGAFGPPAAPR